MQRLAVILGLASILVAGLVGWSAYRVSRNGLIAGYSQDTLNHARWGAEFLSTISSPAFEGDALERLSRKFDANKIWGDSHICVVDEQGRLVHDSSDPRRNGLFLGDRPLFDTEAGTGNPVTLLDLVEQLKPRDGEADPAVLGRAGMCMSLEGKRQLAAFAYAAPLRALVIIHVPWESVERKFKGVILPWAIALALIVFFALPMSLWGLSRAFAGAERTAQVAREAEARTAAQVLILRDIDRAILAGRSVQGIIRGALERLEGLITFQRASVAIFSRDGEVARILAVQSPNPTELGAGAEIPMEKFRSGPLAVLRAGEISVIPDLDASPDLPDFYQRLREEGLRSIARIPLNAHGDLLGTLNLGFERVGTPNEEDLELAREVADVVALAVIEARLREDLEKQAAELERRVEERTKRLSEVNAELEGYVHSVSHDLRAPLRAVHGFGTLLLEDAGSKLGPTEREYLERMLSAAERMKALMSDLLDYSRLAREDIEVRAVDTQHVVEAAQDLLQVELQERHAVVDIVEPLLPVAGHHTSLVLVATNLLSNAAKFVAPGVRPRIRVWTEARGDRVRLWVEDNGIGIAPEKQEAIFRVFERLNGAETYPGTGVGLAIVRRATERMGGASGVESSRGEGSRFWIELPRAGKEP